MDSKKTCYDEIALCAQNTDTIVGATINTIGRACVITHR